MKTNILMGTSNRTAFSRRLAFSRNRKRNGLFNWPTVTFSVKQGEGGPELGQLTIRGRKAVFDAANAGESFRLKKSFWGTRWLYDGDDEREFGHYSFGWNFRPAFTFGDGSRYYLRAKRRWPFQKSAPGKAGQTASFLREDIEVMLLQSFAPMGFLANEVTAPMEGSIATNINDTRIVAGLLLFYQGHLEARNRNAH